MYTKRKAVNERRPTYIQMDGKNRFLWYHNQRWRFGVLDDRNRHDCDICCDDDASFSPENVGSSWRARVSGLDFQVAPEMRLHALLPEMMAVVGTLPEGSLKTAVSCLGVYKKRMVSDRKSQSNAERFIWYDYYNGAWRIKPRNLFRFLGCFCFYKKQRGDEVDERRPTYVNIDDEKQCTCGIATARGGWGPKTT